MIIKVDNVEGVWVKFTPTEFDTVRRALEQYKNPNIIGDIAEEMADKMFPYSLRMMKGENK